MNSAMIHLLSPECCGVTELPKIFNQYSSKRESIPSNLLFFDTEAQWDRENQYEAGQYQRLTIGVAIACRLEAGKVTRRKVCRFRTIQEFWDFLISRLNPDRPLFAFGHNIGYDLGITGLPERLQSGEFRIFNSEKDTKFTDKLGQKKQRTEGFVCLDNPPVILQVFHTTGWKTTFVDTFNYWTMGLAKIGEMLGFPKTEIPLADRPIEEHFAYCENDAQIVEKAVLALIDWIREQNIGSFKYTAPSLAMGLFTKRFDQAKVETHQILPVRQLERKAYYGGRLELFYQGDVKESVYELDVTSLYPHVMKENPYPRKLIKYWTHATHTHYVTPALGPDHIATVKLKTRGPYPVNDPSIGTYYPQGEFWTTLAGPELELALERGEIIDVGEWAKYELADVFSGFVDYMWDYRRTMKIAKNEVYSTFAKLCMNGLYGKYGQMTNGWIDRPDILPSGDFGVYISDSVDGNKTEVFRNIGVCVQQFTGKMEHEKSFPAIAAFVTSNGRVGIEAIRNTAGKENVYYLVTDAAFCNYDGLQNLYAAGMVQENILGKLSLKHYGATAKFEAIHHYRVGAFECEGSMKKGIRRNPDGSITEIHFESLQKLLNRTPDNSVHVVPVTKRFSKTYDRGIIGADGWITPLTRLD